MRLIYVLLCMMPAQFLWAQTIVWADHEHWPPWYYQDDRKGSGMSQRMVNFLMTHLSPLGYSSREVTMNTPRMIKLMQNPDDLVCGTDLAFTPEREKKMTYSRQPSMFTFPIGMVFLARNTGLFAQYVDAKRQISFDDIILDSSLRVGLEKNRAYIENRPPFGTGEFLRKTTDQTRHIYIRDGSNPAQGFVGMLVKDRIDYALGDPYEFTVAAQALGREMEVPPLEFRMLKENVEFYLSYAVCSNNQQGRKVVAHIDRILRENRFKDEYLSILTHYLPSETSKKQYLSDFNRYFGTATPE